jgi:CBS domain containing-hemolysin-like protein
MASLALGWVGEPALAGLVERPIEWLFGTAARGAADFVAIAIAFTLITALHIVLAELVPKGLALQRPEGTTLWVARPLHVFYALFRSPINALNRAQRMKGRDRRSSARGGWSEQAVSSSPELAQDRTETWSR